MWFERIFDETDYQEMATPCPPPLGDQEAGLNFTVFVYFLSKWGQPSAAAAAWSGAQVSWPEILLLPLNSWLRRTCSTGSTTSPGSGSSSPWRRSGGPRSDRSCTRSSAGRRRASDSSKWSPPPPPRSHLRQELRWESVPGYLMLGLPVIVSPSEMSWMAWWWWGRGVVSW